ncbi:DUF1707 SHOCT-like domain-containing protein [Winogradskya humida]|uniref:DUF1707 domain-containing protein n=1 Tax=Winogradskya humida TaxID=113566 RepID=A0ABQ3ZIQ1_9ACTN|nr:DUF1707 domain-containing protein [Actinoplanes humidus]GIE18468.1 hypothetical protein Ahu01nite_015700 [Actinoplanes humidus]
MSSDLSPQPPEWRISSADRERAAGRLRTALDDGRLTLEEYDERLALILAARTYGEVSPHLADLPGGPIAIKVPDFLELRTTAASLKRKGRWVVPRRLLISAKAGSARLNFTEAVIAHPTVEIELQVYAGTTVLVLPAGASADADHVDLVAGSVVQRTVPSIHAEGIHFIITGRQAAGRLIIRYRRSFLGRSW